ncbi:TIGR03087 family PEP-CTERM/XrtA system glycosyltransferase [Altererythrobacter arenosus]|uniref:TIGR03087 family PEP-CTERM/XrtA system glycosyltransferase n=1 Tax=Altererythrobacter arenosus TaxID=3032592 RepID=A0ABY8FQ94_9SPHN|nr:TIGR03087 family PEP-CTERM/XrtA system glycosyltransferase [Altererythrobacter sp. CAU 1644]WFL77186.1 TIGR03087 family PEP-CTERM/XrtA system glycosyltransferase [Altererythrobacter sp. CAU 1644]
MSGILFLAHRIPFPPDRGDKIRAHHILKHLAKLAPVHVGCFAETEKDFAGEAELARLSVSHCLVKRSKPLVLAGAEAVLSGKPVSLTAFYSPKLEQWVKRTIAEQAIDTIFVFSGQMGQYIPDGFAGRVIVDLCDVDSAKFEDYAAAGDRVWINRREGRLLAIEEERLAQRCDATVLISDNEAQLFRSRLLAPHSASIHAIGNGIDAGFFNAEAVLPNCDISEQPGPHFIFTGQMDYRPNELAAIWSIEHFLPAIRERYPPAEFHVVGRNPTDALLKHKDVPGLTVWGEVVDVRPFLVAADMAIIPLTIARGVQNKVLEAMSMELPVMLTAEAATGITATDGEHWLIEAADPTAMVARFDALWAEQNAFRSMGRAARHFVFDRHAWDAVLAPLDKLVSGPGRARHAA